MKKNQEVHRKKRGIIAVVMGLFCLILGLFSMFVFGFCWNQFSLGSNHLPQLRYPVYNCYMTAMGKDGCRYTVVNGRSAVLKYNEDGKVSGVLESSNYRGKDSFSEANQICVDGDGNIYIADLEWSDSGFTVARERVLMYSANGFFKREIYCRDYGDEPAQKSHLMGLRSTGNGICFLMLEDGKACIYTAAAGDNAQLQSEIPYAEVSQIQDAIIGTDGETVYFTDKLCRVCALEPAGTEQLLMSVEGLPEYTVPYHLSGDAEDLLYITDLGNAAVYTVSSEQPAELYYTCENGDAEILQHVFVADETILLTTDQTAYTLEPGSAAAEAWMSTETGSSYTIGWIALWLLQAVFLLVGTVGLATVIVQILVRLYQSGYFKRWKISLIGTAGIILTAILILPMILSNFQGIYFTSYQNEVYLLADITSNTIDAELFDEIEDPTDYNSEAYAELRQSLEDIIDRETAYGDNIYLNLTRLKDDRAYAMFYLDDSIGAYYPLLGEERALLEEVYATKESGHTDDAADVTGSYTYVVTPIQKDDGTVVGAVEVGMDLNAMQGQMREICVDAIISLVMLIIIGVFLLNETVSFVQNREEYKQNPMQEKVPMHELRMMTLLCFTALNMPTSFMPVYLESLHYEGLFFSKTQCGTIPLTVNFALMAVMALFCAPIARRFSFRKTAMAGAAICMLGDIALAMHSFLPAFIGLILNGLGLGLLLNILTICVSGFRSEEEKNKGFAVTTSASLSGMLCGTVIGANLAKYVGESHMFWFSTALWVVELFICYRMGRHFNAYAIVQKQENTKMHWFQFIRKPSIFCFILFVEFPAAVMACFCSYFVPLFTASINMNEVRTSLVVIINSLVGSLASILFADAVLKKLRNHAVYLVCAISALGILLFAWTQNLLTLILAMVLLGLAESIGVPARSTCYCMNKHSIRYGEDRAMGIYNFSDNAGNSAGTSILGAVLGLGTSIGLSIVTVSGAGLMGLYYLIFQRKKKQEKK